MINSTPEQNNAEIAAGKVNAAKALPHLRAKRQELEKEAGALDVAGQRRLALLATFGGAAAVVALYALWGTMTRDEPPILAWVVAVALGIAAAFLMRRSKNMEGARARHLNGLHEKMLSLGRRIDGAERKLRD